MFDIATETLLLLALAAFIAGFIDAIAGGGGLITVPVLLVAGIPPLEALGTNKLQSLFGSGSSVITYAAKGHVDIRSQAPVALISAAASVLGAVLATVLPSDLLMIILPVLLIGVAIYFFIKPSLDNVDRLSRMSSTMFAFTLVPLIGFYDGIFGPGTGSFFMLAYVSLAGFGILKATAHTKLLNFASNAGAFITFAFVGAILWQIGLIMGIAQFFGARLGATFAMKKGAQIIKPMLIITCLLLATKLLMDEQNPLRLYIGL